MEKMEQAVEFEQNVANMPEPDIEFIKKADVMKMMGGVSRSSFDRWQNPKSEYYRPDFPKKFVIDGYVLYVKSEIQAYMKKLIEKR